MNDTPNTTVTETAQTSVDLASLQAQREQLDAQIREQQKSQRASAITTIREMVKTHGFDQDTLIREVFPTTRKASKGTKTPKAGATVGEPKYRNPANPDETWTGRGRPPTWVKEHVENGGDKEVFLIPSV